MICQKCNKDFPEKEIEVSHDVPVYMFEGKDRKEKKQQADKYGRHNLCKQCHKTYEGYIAGVMVKYLSRENKDKMIKSAESFSKIYFMIKRENEDEY
jgi:protein-arginine kinase activator protein McsA